MPFNGFPAGKLRVTPIPDLFFSELLPQIDDLAELKVTLHMLHRLQRTPGMRLIRRSDLLQDATLARSLGGQGKPLAEALDDGLARCVIRGTLLRLDIAGAEGVDQCYLPNSESGRKLAQDIESGLVQLPDARRIERFVPAAERPSIYTLYEQNIGLLQPLIAEQLRDAEETYPNEWIAEAFKRAVENNVRKWTYVRAILERWRLEGKSDEVNRRASESDEFAAIRRDYGGYIRE
ncbi:MAG: DnaD domain protein [Anaerolineae bacterium]|nr:DnaD domain protein [Anaerolineae bacterium]